ERCALLRRTASDRLLAFVAAALVRRGFVERRHRVLTTHVVRVVRKIVAGLTTERAVAAGAVTLDDWVNVVGPGRFVWCDRRGLTPHEQHEASSDRQLANGVRLHGQCLTNSSEAAGTAS